MRSNKSFKKGKTLWSKTKKRCSKPCLIIWGPNLLCDPLLQPYFQNFLPCRKNHKNWYIYLNCYLEYCPLALISTWKWFMQTSGARVLWQPWHFTASKEVSDSFTCWEILGKVNSSILISSPSPCQGTEVLHRTESIWWMLEEKALCVFCFVCKRRGRWSFLYLRMPLSDFQHWIFGAGRRHRLLI